MGIAGIFIDMETTGLDSQKHRGLELALKVIDLSDGQLLGAYSSIIKQTPEVWRQSDPVSLNVNGFRWEDLDAGRTEEEVADEVVQIFESLQIARGKAIFIAQNPTFDRVFFAQLVPVYRQEQLHWPYHWLDFASMYWALQVQKRRNASGSADEINLSKDAIAHQFGLPPEPQPHRAMNGVDHLIYCYGRVVGWIKSPATAF